MITTKLMSKRDLQMDIMMINERIEDISNWEEPDWKMIETLRERRDIKIEQIDQIIKKSIERRR